jgi:catechol-2,3-dioxygenase
VCGWISADWARLVAATTRSAPVVNMLFKTAVDHGFVRSIYFRDPNGYVIELTVSTERMAK